MLVDCRKTTNKKQNKTKQNSMNKLHRNPEVEEPAMSDAVEENPQETPDIEFYNDIRGVVLPMIETVRGKGRAKGKVRYFPKIDFGTVDPFADIRKIVGAENFNKLVYKEVIVPSANEATAAALNEETGQYDQHTWGEAFVNEFTPGSRKGGDGKRELLEKLQALSSELRPFTTAVSEIAAGKRPALSQEDQMRFIALMADWAEINEKLEGKSRKGKKATK